MTSGARGYVRGWSKNEKGLMGLDNSVVIAGGGGEHVGLNGNGKRYNIEKKNNEKIIAET